MKKTSLQTMKTDMQPFDKAVSTRFLPWLANSQRCRRDVDVSTWRAEELINVNFLDMAPVALSLNFAHFVQQADADNRGRG
jgi:hypothetical protein